MRPERIWRASDAAAHDPERDRGQHDVLEPAHTGSSWNFVQPMAGNHPRLMAKTR